MKLLPMLTLVVVVVTQYTAVQGLYTARTVLWSVGNTAKVVYNPSGGHIFTITWGAAFQSINQLTLAYAGYKNTVVNQYISFTAFLTNINLATSSLYFNPSPNNQSSVLYMVFTLIVTQNGYDSHFELLQMVDIVPPTLSQYPRGLDSDVYLFSTAFDLSNPDDYLFWPFISYINVRIPTTSPFEYSGHYLHNITAPSGIYTELSCSNKLTIMTASVSILVVKKSAYTNRLLFLNDEPLSPLTSTISLATPSFVHQDSCFIGIDNTKINHAMAHKQFRYDIRTGFIDYIVQISNTYYVYFNTLCLRMCQQGYIAAATHCATCNQVYPYCLTCHDQTCSLFCSQAILNCHQCSNHTHCDSCLIGTLVTGGCTSTAGCTEVVQSNPGTSSHSATCTACSTGFTLLQNGNCVCSNADEWQVSGLCTDIFGCVAAVEVNGIVQCVACNVSLRLVFNQCSCQDGFQLVGYACSQICGDGKSINDECDDSNTQNGDGCDSSCKVQNSYTCYNRSAVSPSNCVYQARLSVTLSYIDKIKGENSGILSLNIQPSISTISQMNFESLTSFTVDGITVPFNSWTYSDGILQFSFDYNRTLEGGNAILHLSFDPTLVDVLPSQIQFTVDSRSRDLVYYEESQLSRINLVRLLYLCLNGLVLLAVIGGVLCHAMVGVEMLVTTQLVFLMHFQTQNYTEPLSTLQGLTYSFANFHYLFNSQNNLFMGNVYQQLEYNHSNYERTLATVLLLLVVSMIIVGVFHFCIPTSNNKGCQSTFLRLMNNACRYLTLGTLLVVQMTTLDSSKQAYQGQFSTSLISVFEISLKSVSAFLAVRSVIDPKCESFKISPNIHYLRGFLSFLLIATMVFGAELIHGDTNITRSVLLGITLFLACFQLWIQPYRYFFHNMCIFLNCSIVICIALLLSLRDKLPFLAQTENQLLILTTFIIALLLLIVLSYIRIAHVIYLNCLPSSAQPRQERPRVHTLLEQQYLHENRQMHKMIVQMNPYKLESQLSKKGHQEWQETNQNRVELGLGLLSRFKNHLQMKDTVRQTSYRVVSKE